MRSYMSVEIFYDHCSRLNKSGTYKLTRKYIVDRCN